MKNLFLMIIILLASCDNTKQDYISPPDVNVVFDKKVTASTPRFSGLPIEFTVTFPAQFNHRKRWYFDYGQSIESETGGNIVNHTYRKPGTYMIRVEGWNQDNSKMILSDALKILVR